jgi:hypothetical protein
MIRDVIINTNDGLAIFHQNFGNCHSIDDNMDLFGGFISAIQMLSKKLNESEIQLIELKDKKLAFEKTSILTYVIICDFNDSNDEINLKLKRISKIFEDTYSSELKGFKGETTHFSSFAETLIKLNITQKNCGGRPECEGCPNSSKTLPLKDYIKEIDKKTTILSKIKNKLFGKK